jgi:hypothetical protein
MWLEDSHIYVSIDGFRIACSGFYSLVARINRDAGAYKVPQH